MPFDFDGTTPLGLRDAEKPLSPVKVEEKLNHPERRSVAYPDVLYLGTDDIDLMGSDLARSVLKKAFLFEIETVERSTKKIIATPAYGQVGFVHTVDQNGKLSSKESFTALHNIVLDDKYEFSRGRIEFQDDSYLLQFPDCGRVKTDLVPYPLPRSSEGSHHRNDIWKGGIDIAAGPAPCFISLEESFPMVREDFVLEKGQKIGIAVAMPPRDVLLSVFRGKKYKHLDATEVDNIFGISTHRLVNVYTGEITFVGTSHIEYDNNTFEGCSGAIVFLLEKHQPESVKESDYGCAIAVHAGAHPYYDRNLAFVFPRLLRNSGSPV